MSPEQQTHDRVATVIARTRFPFKDQTTWPKEYVTIVNAGSPQHGIAGPDGEHFPDIVIVDGKGEVREVGEVELAVEQASIPYWRLSSEASDDHTDSGERHFFVYVPVGLEDTAKELLDANGISYAGVRGWRIDPDGGVEVVPYVTPGEMYDHQVTRSQ